MIEKDTDGYFAFCLELQGCYTQGGSYVNALENIDDALRRHIEGGYENRHAKFFIPAFKFYK